MERAFPDWFESKGQKVEYFGKTDFQIEIHWNDIIGKVAQNTGYMVSDLKQMDVIEFMITLKNLEKNIKNV